MFRRLLAATSRLATPVSRLTLKQRTPIFAYPEIFATLARGYASAPSGQVATVYRLL